VIRGSRIVDRASWIAGAVLLAVACAAPAFASSDETATALNNRAVTAAQEGRFEDAAALLRQARTRDPGYEPARTNLSAILTDWATQLDRDRQTDRAITLLQEAGTLNPANGVAFARLGDLLYLRRGQIEQAVVAWRQAHKVAPGDARHALANRITQAERDALIERQFSARASAHFDLRVEPPAKLADSPIEEWLEGAYGRLEHALGQGVPRLSVIVYSERTLRRVYNQRDWALGFYDGRIRLRVDETTAPYLPDMIAHELAHAFLHHLYGDRLPVWIHEGYAQLQERPRALSTQEERMETSVRTRTGWVPLKWLDRRFLQPSGTEDIARAYVQARLVVSELVSRHGQAAFQAFLSQLAQGAAIEEAYNTAFAPSTWAKADQGIFE
jgi:tetratricopeptide (TPR) repeat protein